ncbi:MAG: alpha/beta hydrolase [Pseudomonadota bacterium]
MNDPQRVMFDVAGDQVVGHLHLPVGGETYAGIVVAGPMTSVKEQVTGVYAAAFATRGIAALCLDHRHFGESGGTPRQYEFYRHKIEDLRAGLDALGLHPQIDAERLGLVGVCLGAGYAAHAAIDHSKVKAFGAVVGYYRDVRQIRSVDPAAFDAKVAQGTQARETYEATGDVEMIPAAALEGDAAMTLRSTYDYYATPRAGVPNYTNAFAVMSREHFLTFDVQLAAPHITAPTRMVHARSALSPRSAQQFYDKLECEKDIHWLEGPDQTAFYDDAMLVGQAADLLVSHLGKQLGVN